MTFISSSNLLIAKNYQMYGPVQKDPPSKAADPLASGTYKKYVSMARGRERRWWAFSTDPGKILERWL